VSDNKFFLKKYVCLVCYIINKNIVEHEIVNILMLNCQMIFEIVLEKYIYTEWKKIGYN